MTEGKLARWLKKIGDDVRAGDVIAEIETDKATMEVEAVDEGTLSRILVEEGTEGVAVNTPIAVLGEGEAEAAARPPPRSAAEAGADAVAAPKPAAPRHTAPAAAAAPEKDWGATSSITVREALRDAMARRCGATATCS